MRMLYSSGQYFYNIAGRALPKGLAVIVLVSVLFVALVIIVKSGMERVESDGSGKRLKTSTDKRAENEKPQTRPRSNKVVEDNNALAIRQDGQSQDDPSEPTATPATSPFSLCRISGVVTDEKGKPLAGIGIYRIKNTAPLSGFNSNRISSFADLDPELLARSNRDGEYSTTTIPAGQSWLAAYDAQYAFPLLQGTNPRSVAMIPGGEETVNFRLFRRFLISGKVMNQLQKPVKGASIKVRAAKFTKEYQPVLPLKAVSDGQGKYELDSLPEGIYALAAALDGYADDAKVEVRAGSKNVDFVLAPESGVRGRVTIGGTGEPVAGIMVIATGGGVSRGGSYAKAEVILKPGHAKTDSKGFYEIKGLNAGLYPVVVAKHQADGKTLVAPTKEVEIPIGQVVDNTDFVLTEGLSISGRVLEKSSKQPIAGATVVSTLEYNSRAVTDSQGVYRISGVRPRRQFLRVEAPGYAMKDTAGYNEQGVGCAPNIHRQLDMLPGQPATGIDFEMDPAATIMGRVVNQKRDPLADVSISLLRDSGLPYVAAWDGKFKTDSKGIYKIGDVYEGNYYVKASSPRYVTGGSGIVSAKMAEIVQVPDVVLVGSGASISGKITGANGSPVANAAVKIVEVYQRTDGITNTAADISTNGETRSDGDGVYSISMIGRGEVEIQVSASGYSLATKRIMVDDLSRIYTEDFVLESASIIGGIVRDTEGAPLPNASILAQDQSAPNGQFMDGASSKADGSFRLDRIAESSKYALDVTLTGYVSQRLANIPAGKDDVVVTMSKCGVIAGKVVDSVSGAPVKDFALFVIHADSEEMPQLDAEQNKIHSPDGIFRRENLQPGQYQLVILAAGYRRFVKEAIPVEEGKTITLETSKLLRE